MGEQQLRSRAALLEESMQEAEIKIEELEGKLENCKENLSDGEFKIGEMEAQVDDLKLEAEKHQAAVDEVELLLKQEVEKVKAEKEISEQLKKQVTTVKAELVTKTEDLKELQSSLDSERERAKKEREELGDCLRKASKEAASDEEGRNCNSPCTITKIAGNDLIGMSQQQEEEVTQSQFESKDNVNGIEETTDTTPVSAVEGLFF